MGNKVHSPVVPYADVVEKLDSGQLATLQRSFAECLEGRSLEVTAGVDGGDIPGGGGGGSEDPGVRVSAPAAAPAVPKEGAALSLDAFRNSLGSPFREFGEQVVERLFVVLDSDASKGVSYSQFVVAVYVFRFGTRDEKLQLVFNLFDLAASGNVTAKDFRQMALALLVGREEAKYTFRMAGSGRGREEEVEYDMAFLKPMAKLMAEMAMEEYDGYEGSEPRGKLELREWKRYAEADEDVQRFLKQMGEAGKLALP